MPGRMRVGVLGCGMVSPQYAAGMSAFEILDVVACADREPERARDAAEKHFCSARAYTPEELLAADDVEIVLNLTPGALHARLNLAAIAAGKHVYSEKPLAGSVADAEAIVEAARRASVLVGCAPDTFLGGGLQTARRAIDEGMIGTPTAAIAFLAEWGPENWHPDPLPHYQPGSGPMLDMGPYYVTALISLLGPARRAAGAAHSSEEQRTVATAALRGTPVEVAVSTHVAGIIEFAGGAIANLTVTWEGWAATLPHIQVYGTEGTLTVPDPDTHSGAVEVRRRDEQQWRTVPLTHDASVARGIGVAEMAYAIRAGREPRASGALALHALELICAFEESSHRGSFLEIRNACRRPEPLEAGLPHGVLERSP